MLMQMFFFFKQLILVKDIWFHTKMFQENAHRCALESHSFYFISYLISHISQPQRSMNENHWKKLNKYEKK